MVENDAFWGMLITKHKEPKSYMHSQNMFWALQISVYFHLKTTYDISGMYVCDLDW